MLTPEQEKERDEILAKVNGMKKDKIILDDLILPKYDPKAQDIQELEDDLELIGVLLVLLKNKERAVKITVSLPHGQSLEYGIDDNSNARQMLINERKFIQAQLNDLKNEDRD